MSHRILIVEDDPTIRLGLEMTLLKSGYDVVTRADAESAEADVGHQRRPGALRLRPRRERGGGTAQGLRARGDDRLGGSAVSTGHRVSGDTEGGWRPLVAMTEVGQPNDRCFRDSRRGRSRQMRRTAGV